ncbi:MAG: acriflavin resistance protein [Deltaproteobacteria bacterium CG11_big_fil_rev_8_21_14_0_20_47_16]|nr:MAG: acriflavin resistance protein [Deltaproteobacteria bacterium CG11_big_fil_rev_8_21_14_0_20_47_16]
MTLSDIAIRNPVFAWMLMAALIFFGWIGFDRLGISQMPDVDFPVINVFVTLEGAAPSIMESDVADIVEDAVMSVDGIRNVTSTSREGQTNVTIEFELNRNIDAALQEVQTKIAQAQLRLPKDIDPPVVTKTNPEDQPIMWVALSGDKPVRELMAYTRDYLKNQFQTIPGVGEVVLGGFLEPNLRVWVDSDKLNYYQIVAKDLFDAIERGQIEKPAGRLETNTKESIVRVMGETQNVKDFSNILISQRGGLPIYTPIHVGDVSDVELGMEDLRRISRSYGHPAVGLGIKKQRGQNAVAIADAVKKKMDIVQKGLPSGMKLSVNFDGTEFIKDSVDELKFTLLLSALLTAMVCWLFLGSWSSTFNILMAIPTSIFGTFMIIYFMGFTLNTFTLLGLILAIGIVVDDSIMVLENIFRYQESGENHVTAASKGARQITFAAIAATIAIIAIFLPVAFMRGIIGKFFYQFGVTISIAVAISLLEALTLTPMRCAQFVVAGSRTSKLGQRLDRMVHELSVAYHRYLALALQHRWKVVTGSLLFFFLSLGLSSCLKKEFVPAQDQGMVFVRMQAPAGSSIDYTNEKFKAAEEFLMSRPEVRKYYAAIGGFNGGEVNSGIIFVSMVPRKERKLSQQQFMEVLRKQFNSISPDVQAIIQDLSLSGFTAQRGFPIEFSIRGQNWDTITDTSKKIVDAMQKSPFFSDVDSDYKDGMMEVQVVPNREAAAAHAVSVEDITTTLNILVGGIRDGKFTEDGHRNDIRLRLKAKDREDKSQLENLYVRNNRGELVKLSDVVTIVEKPALITITRFNRERAVSIYANVGKGKSQADALKEVKTLSTPLLPDGYRIVFSGSAEAFKDSFQSLLFALWLGIIVSYMVLASQFNSFLHPITILLALPFSVSGAFIGLLLGGFSLNIYSMIGIILLMGIVKKNSILLVDFTNQVRDHEGANVHDALLKACPLRLRPILMTSIATIAAAIPPALSFGPGAESRTPMAAAVIGGVIVSTILTLFVIPCVYSLFTRFEGKRTVIE